MIVFRAKKRRSCFAYNGTRVKCYVDKNCEQAPI